MAGGARENRIKYKGAAGVYLLCDHRVELVGEHLRKCWLELPYRGFVSCSELDSGRRGESCRREPPAALAHRVQARHLAELRPISAADDGDGVC